jgi:putative transposase
VADEALTSTIRTVWSCSRQTYGVRRVRASWAWPWVSRLGCAGSGRKFQADRSDRLWLTDITEHATGEGKVYCAAVLDVFSRRVVGWSIADHLRAELVVDTLDMARWRRKPQGTVVHSDRGGQYVLWIFGQRLRQAGLSGSMGKVACVLDNAMMEAFFSSMQVELLDRREWATRAELANGIFEYIEAWYNPTRRHSGIGYHSPVAYEQLPTQATSVA